MITDSALYKKLSAMTDWECSSSPEGNWHDCCVVHDYDYIEGTNKWVADFKLARCIVKKGHPGVALVYYAAVTVFGWKPYLRYKRLREMAGFD